MELHPADVLPWHLYEKFFKYDLFIAGLVTVSESNDRSHYRKKYARHCKQQKQLLDFLHRQEEKINFRMPAHISFYRHAPRMLDDDNNVYAFKYVKDGLCDYLCPGLAAGRADGRLEITWSYMQIKSKISGIGIRIYEAKI